MQLPAFLGSKISILRQRAGIPNTKTFGITKENSTQGFVQIRSHATFRRGGDVRRTKPGTFVLSNSRNAVARKYMHAHTHTRALARAYIICQLGNFFRATACKFVHFIIPIHPTNKSANSYRVREGVETSALSKQTFHERP